MNTSELETRVYDLLGSVIDPELGRSVTELNMVTGVSVGEAENLDASKPVYNVRIKLELTVPNCPLAEIITERVKEAVSKYPQATLIPHVTSSAMSKDKLEKLVEDLKAERRENPFNKTGTRTKIFAIASGKGGVGKSSITANLAATFAALGYDTAAIDADVYGFSLPRMFGVNSQPTNLNGMLMPVVS
ncbi:MRP family ATP-binding protein, partial [Bifidobacteriaceae bacterium NR003]